MDIDASKLAEQRRSNAEVKAFGQRMATDHTAEVAERDLYDFGGAHCVRVVGRVLGALDDVR